jgi:chitin disaccharide deacetylase
LDRFYTKAIENLQPSITQITVHLTYDDEEMRAVTIDHSEYDAAWRQRDLDFFTSKRTKELLEKNDIRLVNWRELGKLLQC